MLSYVYLSTFRVKYMTFYCNTQKIDLNFSAFWEFFVDYGEISITSAHYTREF